MSFDEIMARMEASKININAVVDIASMENWDVACLIGRTVSLAFNGYEDDFDGMDWEDAARELRYSAKYEGEQFTRKSIIKALGEMEYI